MLNIGRLSPDAAEYYIGEVATSAEDYYTGRGESEGRWVGSLAETIGLQGAVEPEDFRAVLDGRHPRTGERLVRSRTGTATNAAAPNQPTLFDGDTLDVPRVAARLKVSVGRVWQLLWAGERAAARPDERPKRYLVGSKKAREDHRGDTWIIPRVEVERYETAHRAAKARPGYDITLRPPKSVSILWALGDEQQRQEIRQAHRESVDAVVDYIERHALYARRGNGDRGKVETDGLVAAAFDHRTSRAGDPLLHTHVVTANLTRTSDGNWQAIDGRPLFDQARPGGFLYQAHLRHILSDRLGVRWEQVHNGWAEVEGVPEEVIRAFSKRREEIEELVAEAGYSSARAHQLATLKSRKAKEYDVDADTLQGRWRTEAEALGFGPEEIAECLGHQVEPVGIDSRRLFQNLAGAEGLTRQASTFGGKDIVQALCERVGVTANATTIERLADEFISSDLVTVLAQQPNNLEQVHRRGGGRRRSQDLAHYTTPELLDLEARLLQWADDGFGVRVPAAHLDAVDRAVAARSSLSEEQAAMIRRVCATDAPAVQLVAGRPGSGKTYATAACVEAFVSSGVPVIGCALSATAAAELESATNLQVLTGQPARTIARTLLDIRRHGLPNGVVLLVDEASMVGTRDLAALVEHVGAVGGSIKLIGDPDQHGPVDAGGFFAALCREHEAEVVGLVANNRQLDPIERAAIEDFRQGRVPAALARFEATGRIVKAPTAAASHNAMVDDWWSAVSQGGDDPMIAGPNKIRAQLNALARQRFRTEGRLGADALLVGRREFSAGDWVVAKRNDRRLRSPSGDFVKNGSAGVVVGVEQAEGALVVEFSKEGRITLPASYLEQRNVDYGYARTTYGVQGATLDRALYYASDQSSFEEGYVALTRGRREARVYIVDGTVLHDEDSAHRGHDPEPSGLDTVTEAMERRRANRLAYEDDAAAADVVREFDGWTLREVADERRRLRDALSEAPPDVNRAMAATSRQLDALVTRRQAWEQAAHERDGSDGKGRSGDQARQRSDREIASLDVAIRRTEKRFAALRDQWGARRDYLEEHRDEVERLRLAIAAERALELKTRTSAAIDPPSRVVQVLGARPGDYTAAQMWRNAVEEAVLYLEHHGDGLDTSATDPVESVLGTRPAGEAAWAYERAAMAVRASLAAPEIERGVAELQLD